MVVGHGGDGDSYPQPVHSALIRLLDSICLPLCQLSFSSKLLQYEQDFCHRRFPHTHGTQQFWLSLYLYCP